MRKIVLIVALIVPFQITYAQITWIPKAGLTSSEIRTKIDETDGTVKYYSGNTKVKLGFTAGLGINIPITKTLSLQPELSFVQKGHSASTDIHTLTINNEVVESYNIDAKVTLSYLEMPVLAKYTVSLAKGAAQLFVVAGPSFALGVGGKIKQETTFYNRGTTTTRSEEADVKFGSNERFPGGNYGVERRGDIGLQTGIGAVLFKKIIVDVRYTFGMTKLWDVEEIDIRYKNRALQFTVGVPLTLKK